MSTAIFIRTFARDIEWFKYCVRSVVRQCRGFSEIIVHVDTNEEALFLPLLPKGWRLVSSHPYCRAGYASQQIAKVHADQWCRATEICFVDSDCVFYLPTRPEDLLRDGKIMLLYGGWSSPSVVSDGATIWRRPMEEVLGEPVHAEFMRRFTLTYRSDTLRAFRKWIEQKKLQPVAKYLANVKKLSEFNLLGAWAWKHQHDAYCWLDVERDDLPELRLQQFWSYGGVEKNRLALEELLER